MDNPISESDKALQTLQNQMLQGIRDWEIHYNCKMQYMHTGAYGEGYYVKTGVFVDGQGIEIFSRFYMKVNQNTDDRIERQNLSYSGFEYGRGFDVDDLYPEDE